MFEIWWKAGFETTGTRVPASNLNSCLRPRGSVQPTVQGGVAGTGVGRFWVRWLAEAARHIIEGRSSRIGASTSQATLRNCSNAAVSYSAAVSNRSMYPLGTLVDSGGGP